MNILCEPFFSKYNLINDKSGQSYKNFKNGYISKKIVYYLDGNHDIIDISKKIKEDFFKIINIINIFLDNKLIRIKS